ncbi:MAG: 2-oxo acid dehydrogenase subunit E2 [Bacteroidia bacterium]|nr:2-oxo acid dehydrogenase subunit E2 [Bacteroidia bacterium]
MTQVELIMPKMGESVAEATIIKWLKKEGDKIAMDEPVLEIATDKVDSEISSTAEGILAKRLFGEGVVVQVGKAVALISSDVSAATAEAPKITPPATAKTFSVQQTHENTSVAPSSNTPKNSESSKFYSPLVRSIAKQEGLSMAELDTIAGTGKDGRVTKNDILTYIPGKSKASIQQLVNVNGSAHTQAPSIQKPSISVGGKDEIVEMDRMRKLIADHMVMSKQVSPHVTSFVEADVTNIVNWRNKIKSSFEKREGEKLTFTPIFIEAIVKAIKDFPMINVSVDGTKIIVRKNINIGMAAALPSGNLIVPVIKGADQLNMLGLAKAVNDLTNRARSNKLLPDEIQGGTYTLSNVGTFGNIMGTPIINQPQVAIMAVGIIRKKPVVIETPQGDTIGIRHMMILSHAYDHRVIDGALGGSFVRRVADYLEQFDTNRII